MNETTEPIKLLLVDDEPEFLDSSARVLSRRGFAVQQASDGQTALRLLEGARADVVLLDLKMPGMDGVEVMREIKKRWPAVQVVMLTGHGTLRQSLDLTREGVYEYLAKPCDPEKLAAVAREAAAAGRQLLEQAPSVDEGTEVRLLIIDDEEELTAGLAKTLGRRKMRVTTAASGALALDILDQQAFDVVLLDIKMPGISGLDLLLLIKKKVPFVEVILLTGHPTVEEALKGLGKGAFDYLLKPQEVETLTTTIRCACQRSRANPAKDRRR
jgi:DNA-binding NtrC family response regulator